MAFEIGQKVVCIQTDAKAGIFSGKVYTVFDVKQCSCGHVHLCVGFKENELIEWQCAKCPKTFLFSVMRFHCAWRFLPYSENELLEADEAIQELLNPDLITI